MATVQTPVRGIREATVKLVMELYRGDDAAIESVQSWIERYLPEESLKLQAIQLKLLWYRQADLMGRLTNQDLIQYSTRLGDRAGRHIRNRMLGQLEEDMRQFSDATWGKEYFRTFIHRDDVRKCNLTLEQGYMLWIELRSKALVVLADLAARILRRVEKMYGDESATSLLGAFVAGRGAIYEAGILDGDTNKWLEERTAMMYVVAYAISPPDENDEIVLKELEQIIKAAVRVAGLRFATSYQPTLASLEREATEQWFSLHVPESVGKRFQWINDASERVGVKQKPIFEVHPTYANKLLPTERWTGKFPTPFFFVPERYWKHSIMDDELFPSYILTGRIPLFPVHPRHLFLTSRNKQSPSDLILSPRGGGKCLSGDDEIFCADGSILTVKQAFEEKLRPRVFSIGSNLKLEHDRIVEIESNGLRGILRIQTADGSSIRLTSNHPVLTPSGWKPVCELLEGDLIALPRDLEVASDIYWSKIKKIKPIRAEETFDVQVEKNHNLIVNGIIVHNTTLQNSTACWKIDRGYIMFEPTMPRDQALCVCVPMIEGESKNSKMDWKCLADLRIAPRGMPARFVTIYENEDDVRTNAAYTIYDRKLRVDSLEDFHLDWTKALSDMPQGYFMVRDLAEKNRTNMMRNMLLIDFFDWRRVDRSRKVAIGVDEVQDIYGAVFASGEEAALVRTVQSELNDIRGLGLPTEFATSRPVLLQPDILESVSSFIFGEVRESGVDKSRSSRQRLFEAIRAVLPSSEAAYMTLVQKIMENVKLSSLHLFFMLDHNRRLRLIRATLPPHMQEDPEMDPETRMKDYEKRTGKKVLVDGWNEVKELEGGSRSRKKQHKDTRPVYGLDPDLPATD